MDYLIYLAGPITNLSWQEATEWRKYMIDKFMDASKNGKYYISLSPLRGKEYLSSENDIKDQYTQHKMSTQKVITRRDLNDVKRSDLIIVNLLNTSRISIGTILEIGAAAILNIPIILIMEEAKSSLLVSEDASKKLVLSDKSDDILKNVHDHSMVRESATLVCETLDEAFNFAIHFLG